MHMSIKAIDRQSIALMTEELRLTERIGDEELVTDFLYTYEYKNNNDKKSDRFTTIIEA